MTQQFHIDPAFNSPHKHKPQPPNKRDPSCNPLADYAVIKTLGSGATGTVKLARHLPSGQLVALKIIKDSLMLSDSALYKKSRREIAVLKLLSCFTQALEQRTVLPVSPRLGIMQLLDVFKAPKATVLVLEYCEGGDLFDLLVQNGCLPLHVVHDYLHQLVHALHFCHLRGVCHRDLKPENVLLTGGNRLKLVDFGVATMHTPGIKLQTSCGSAQYCAPEVLLNQPYDGRGADVWSLGVTLYVMTTGGLPFDDDNLQRLSAKIRSGVFYIPPEVPDSLADLLRAMLTVDPSERISLEGIMSSAWFQSSALRSDLFVERPGMRIAPPSVGAPVHEPEADVIRHLVDLGLGNSLTIKLRIAAETPGKEREFYHALASFRSALPMQKPTQPVQDHSLTQEFNATVSSIAMHPVGCAPEPACNDGVAAVVGRPPPMAVAAVAADLPGVMGVPGSRLLDSVRSLVLGSLPEQPAGIATVVGSESPAATTAANVTLG